MTSSIRNIVSLGLSALALWLGVACAAQASSNLALSGTASQSSTYPGGFAERANDGNRDTRWGSGSVQHTQDGSGEWWAVSFAQPAWVGEIDVFNGQADEPCCANRINGFMVELYSGASLVWTSGSVGSFVPDIVAPNVSGMSFVLPTAMLGDRVLVTKTWPDFLHMAEVEVWSASPVPEPGSWALMVLGAAAVTRLAGRRL